MSIVPVKLRLNDHGEASIRRFGNDLSSLAGFVRQVLTLSTYHPGDSPSPIRVTITYIDDDSDTVTVGSELEWQEMIRILLSQRRDGRPLLHLSAGLTTTQAHRSGSPRGREPQTDVGASESTAAPTTSNNAPLHVRLGAILEDFSLGLAEYGAVQAAFSEAVAAGCATVTVEVRVCHARWLSTCGNDTDACALLHTLRGEMDPEVFNALRLHKDFDNSRDHPNFPLAVGFDHLQQQQQQSQRQGTPVLLTFDTDDESGADAEQHNDLAVSRSFGSLAALDRMHNFMEMFPMLTQAEAIVLTNFPTDDEAVHHALTQMAVPPQR